MTLMLSRGPDFGYIDNHRCCRKVQGDWMTDLEGMGKWMVREATERFTSKETCFTDGVGPGVTGPGVAVFTVGADAE